MRSLTTFGAVAVAAVTFGIVNEHSAPHSKGMIVIAQATDDTGTVAGQGKSNMPTTGAGSKQSYGPNSEGQGGTGVEGSAQGEGATNKDTTPRDAGAAPVPKGTPE